MKSNNITEKYICHECVGESYLKSAIKDSGRKKKCSYCGNKHESLSLVDFADKIDTAFEQHFIQSSDSPPDN